MLKLKLFLYSWIYFLNFAKNLRTPFQNSKNNFSRHSTNSIIGVAVESMWKHIYNAFLVNYIYFIILAINNVVLLKYIDYANLILFNMFFQLNYLYIKIRRGKKNKLIRIKHFMCKLYMNDFPFSIYSKRPPICWRVLISSLAAVLMIRWPYMLQGYRWELP